MQTTDKVQTTDSTTGTGTSTTSTYYTYADPSPSYKTEKGWECPRCGHINAPWVRQCDCNRGWDITCDDTTPGDEWWKKYVTCDSDTFKIHPDNITFVSGSDYRAADTYVNIQGTQSNKVEPNITAWNCTNPDNCHTPHYTTKTVVNDGIHNFYNLRTPKETK